ncbi:MAG: Hsp33 family molecular chaperone HslO [Gemmatimonadota bacterium]
MIDGSEYYLVRAAAYDGRVRALAIDSTNVVETLRGVQRTEPAVTAALGRVVTGALLFGALLKEENHLVTVRVRGDGPAGMLLASANGRGEVRGLVTNPRPGVEQVRRGKLNVAGAVGRRGRLTVTRDLGVGEPYASTVELVSGEIGEDLAYYLARSEQIPSAVGIGVFVRRDGSVEAGGGYMIQLVGGLDDDEAASLEAEIGALPHPTTMLRSGDSPEDILGRIFDDDVRTLERRPVRFHCPCSRERAERALILLGESALEDLRTHAAADEEEEEEEEEGVTELVCDFCTTPYRFTDDEVRELIAEAERT